MIHKRRQVINNNENDPTLSTYSLEPSKGHTDIRVLSTATRVLRHFGINVITLNKRQRVKNRNVAGLPCSVEGAADPSLCNSALLVITSWSSSSERAICQIQHNNVVSLNGFIHRVEVISGSYHIIFLCNTDLSFIVTRRTCSQLKRT